MNFEPRTTLLQRSSQLPIQLVPSKSGPSEFLAKARRRPRAKNSDPEVQESADDDYLERESDDEEGESNDSPE